MPRNTPKFVRHVRRFQPWFDVADEVLKTMWAARGGGRLSGALAAITSLGKVIETVYPAESGWALMRQMDLRDADLTVGGYLCDLLMKGREYDVVALTQFGTMTVVWRKEDGSPLAGAMYSGPKFSDGPFLPQGGREAFFEAVREVAWTKAPELKLVLLKAHDYSWRAARRFHLGRMIPLGPYIGKMRPEDHAARLAAYPPGPRTLLLRGPTGVGKSVLARHVSRLLAGEKARLLKVSSEVLKKCQSDEVKALVECLQPTVLLLDDLNLTEESEFFLDLLETLRLPNTLTIPTMMTKFADKEEPKPGCWHFPGMRSGRIDAVATLYPPDAEERAWQLDHYADAHGLDLKRKLRKKLVKATEGFTGAFIGDIILRLATHGTQHWRDEVNAVLYMAPFENEEDEENEKDEEGGSPPSKDDTSHPKVN